MAIIITKEGLVNILFGIPVFTIGLLNMILIHPVPGTVFLLLSLIYFPPVNKYLRKKIGFVIPLAIKIFLGLVIIWFTLGISDLGDLMDG